MRAFRGTRALTWAGFLSTVRSKAALFWTMAFPIFLLILFAYIFGAGEAERVAYLMPGLWTITVISSSFFGISMSMVQERENGTFRRYRVSPLSPIALVSSFGLLQVGILLSSLLLQGVIAWFWFGSRSAGPIWVLILVMLFGIFAFVPLGLLVGSIARDMKTAPVLTNLLFFPMMFLSGAAVPFFVLPDFIQRIAKLLPATYLVEALQGVVVRGEGLLQLGGPIAVLLTTGVLGLAVNSLLFRWESTQPLKKSNLLIALGVLTAIYAVAFFIAPDLRMSIAPSGD